MEPDILVLGDFVFDEWSTPEGLPAGGRQSLKITDLPGGGRVVDVWGPADDPRAWNGIIRGDDALDQALQLDQMRISGQELPFSNGVEARTVVIGEFIYRVRRGLIEYQISVVTTDDNGSGLGGGGAGFGIAEAGISVLADLAAAVGLFA